MVIKNKTKTKRGKKYLGELLKPIGGNRRGGGGGGRDEVWDRETMFSQLTKWSPRVVVSGKLEYFSHSNYF